MQLVQSHEDTTRALVVRKEFLKHLSKTLDHFTEDDTIPRLIWQSAGLEASAVITEKIQEWISAPQNRLLWIYGPADASNPSQLTLCAVQILGLIDGLEIPRLAFVCEPVKDRRLLGPDRRRSRKATTLVAMIYTLLRQLIEALPEDFAGEGKELGLEKFELLDESTESLYDAIDLLANLITQTKFPLIFVVIDKLQWAEEKDTVEWLEHLMFVLTSQYPGTVLKLLVTTSGLSQFLMTRVSKSDRLDAMYEAQPRMPGSRPIGGIRIPVQGGEK